jgi:hypothetical protein
MLGRFGAWFRSLRRHIIIVSGGVGFLFIPVDDRAVVEVDE